jgi:hypothetical protein
MIHDLRPLKPRVNFVIRTIRSGPCAREVSKVEAKRRNVRFLENTSSAIGLLRGWQESDLKYVDGEKIRLVRIKCSYCDPDGIIALTGAGLRRLWFKNLVTEWGPRTKLAET